jgi:hypothetical protein
MMCAWEQKETIQISTLRPRLPAMAERIWNPNAGRDYTDFDARFRHADASLARIVAPVSISEQGLVARVNQPPHPNFFHESLTVKIKSVIPGEIHYSLDGSDPTRESPRYSSPIELKRSAIVKTQGFDLQYRPRGYIEWCEYTQITPTLSYRYFKAPAGGWTVTPDFASLQPDGTGLLDTFRSFGLDSRYAVTMEGRAEIPSTGEYEIRVRLSQAAASLSLGDRQVFEVNQPDSGKPWWEPTSFKVLLHKGIVPVRWRYTAQTIAG